MSCLEAVTAANNTAIPIAGHVAAPPRAQLLPWQVQHVMELMDILIEKNRALDGSDTGTGKTYMALMLAILLGLRPFVVAPYAALPGWVQVAELLGINLFGLANYETLKNCHYYPDPVLDENESLVGKSIGCPHLRKVFIDGVPIDPSIDDTDAEDEEVEQNMNENLQRAALSSSESETEDEGEEFLGDGEGEERDIDEDGKVDRFARATKRERLAREKNTHLHRGKFDYEFDLPQDVFLIFDEAHRMKNPGSVTSKLLTAATKLEQNKMLIISATLTDKIKTFNSFGSFFGFYESPRGYAGWMRRQLKMLRVKHKQRQLTEKQSKLDAIHNAMKPFMRRIRKRTLGNLFPEEKIIAQCLELPESAEVQMLYDELKQAFEDLKSKEKRAMALAKLTRIRQKVELLKVPIFVTRARQEMAAGRSVVLFTNFEETISQLQAELNCECVIHGEQTMAERQWSIREFQSNRSHCIIVNNQSGGVALSLHDLHGRQRIALHNITWSGGVTIQSCGRIHRANGKSEALQYLLYVNKTYETRIAELVSEKIGVLYGINDGQLEGTDFNMEQIFHDALGVPVQVIRHEVASPAPALAPEAEPVEVLAEEKEEKDKLEERQRKIPVPRRPNAIPVNAAPLLRVGADARLVRHPPPAHRFARLEQLARASAGRH